MEDNNKNEEFQFIQERVKQVPLNRKKLIRRTVITAAMAVIFGVLACFTFLVLEPVFSNFLHPQEPIQTVTIPDDVDEILPEDMVLEDEQEPTIQIIEQKSEVDPKQLYINEYEELYGIVKGVMPSIVTVTSVKQDVDWFDNSYENKSSTSGIYVANNGRQSLILAHTDAIENSEEISVTFYDGTSASGAIKQKDANTGLCIVAVEIANIEDKTWKNIKVATLGNSKVSTLITTPIIAIGRPYGSSDSVAYGMLASKSLCSDRADQNYEMFTTDIYGSKNATGIIVDLRGEVLGIIDQSLNTEDAANLISALGISDIKKDIERMSNGKAKTYLGVKGVDVSKYANQSQGVPTGAFVKEIVMGSPAMNAGIQSGDVIVELGGREINKYSDLLTALGEKYPGNTVTVKVMRQGGDSYQEIDLEITLGQN